MYFHFLSFTSALKYILLYCLYCIPFKNQSNKKLNPAELIRLTMHNTNEKRHLRQLFYFSFFNSFISFCCRKKLEFTILRAYFCYRSVFQGWWYSKFRGCKANTDVACLQVVAKKQVIAKGNIDSKAYDLSQRLVQVCNQWENNWVVEVEDVHPFSPQFFKEGVASFEKIRFVILKNFFLISSVMYRQNLVQKA